MTRGDEVPEWAKKRACELVNTEVGEVAWDVSEVDTAESLRAFARYIAEREAPPSTTSEGRTVGEPDDVLTCPVCGAPLPVHYMGTVLRRHDHKTDGTGLDDGPFLPGCAPRKKRVVDPETFSAERKRAWKTRRAKYGTRGHR